jgi:hypothetical protein
MDNPYEGFFTKQVIKDGNRIWEVYHGNLFLGHARDEQAAKRLVIKTTNRERYCFTRRY